MSHDGWTVVFCLMRLITAGARETQMGLSRINHQQPQPGKAHSDLTNLSTYLSDVSRNHGKFDRLPAASLQQRVEPVGYFVSFLPYSFGSGSFPDKKFAILS